MTVTVDVNRPYFENRNCKIYLGDALKIMKMMPAGSKHMCVTSPPFWGLRWYKTEPQIWDGDLNCLHEWKEAQYKMHNGRGDAQKGGKYSEQEPIPDVDITEALCLKCGAWQGELGLESTRELFIDHLMQIFDQVYRLLTKDGICFVNLGDTYASRSKGLGGTGRLSYGDGAFERLKERAGFWPPRRFDLGDTLKPGALSKIPAMFELAMEAHGWQLFDRIVWEKPNPAPENVDGRSSRSYEFIFVFAKNLKSYFYEQQHEPYKPDTEYEKQQVDEYIKQNCGGARPNLLGRNIRNVWRISTESYDGAHYAPYPEELCRRCTTIGCPEFICRKCHHRRESIKDAFYVDTRPGLNTGNGKSGKLDDPHANLHNSEYSKKRQKKISILKGLTDCGCNAGWYAGTVFDPFFGSGSTCAAALQLGRNIEGIELNRDYIDDAIRLRLGKDLAQERFEF